MSRIIAGALMGLMGLVAVGLLALQSNASPALDDQTVKRDEDTAEVTVVDDEDDNDTLDETRSRRSPDSRVSRSDATRDQASRQISRQTANTMSRAEPTPAPAPAQADVSRNTMSRDGGAVDASRDASDVSRQDASRDASSVSGDDSNVSRDGSGDDSNG